MNITALIMKYRFFGFFFALLFTAWSCVDQDFDEPPVPGLPDITPNTTIQELKALHTIGTEDKRIDTDIIIGGIVVADDESGNFFKTIIIEDETGGIELRLNSVGLYNSFPIGRQVSVLCEGLYIGDYNGVIQLNGSPEEPLEEALIGDHVIGGARDQDIIPDTLSISELSGHNISTLVYFRELQFVSSDTGVVYADVPNRKSINRILEDCNGNTILLRTSGFADFGDGLTPAGRGSLTAVFSVFGDTKQLMIRDLADISFEGARCGQGGGGQNPVLITVQEARELFAGGAAVVPALRKIRGVVISDADNGNTDPRNLIIQQGSAGIVIRFLDAHNFSLGQEVEIDVSGQPFSEYRGLLQIENVANERATTQGSGNLPAPRTATVGEILANAEAWESTLVEIDSVSVSGNTNWEGIATAADPTGTITVFTRGAASFADDTIPTEKVRLTAILSEFDDPQLMFRNLGDLTILDDGNSGGDGRDTLTELNEPFTTQTDGTEISLRGWINLAVKGTRRWEAREFNGNFYAQATAFNSPDLEMETWLITPPIRLDEHRFLSFRSAQAFYEHDGLSVWISKDFNGDNFSEATWTELDAIIAGDNITQNQWLNSGDIDLAEFDGIVYIGFRYIGTSSTNTTTYRIDDVQIKKP
jgi:hypothetical protein